MEPMKERMAAVVATLEPKRPTAYTPQLGSMICERLAAGDNLRAFCVWPNWPTKRTVNQWAKQIPAFGDRYRRILRTRSKLQEGSFETSTRDHPPARAGQAAENSTETAVSVAEKQAHSGAENSD